MNELDSVTNAGKTYVKLTDRERIVLITGAIIVFLGCLWYFDREKRIEDLKEIIKAERAEKAEMKAEAKEDKEELKNLLIEKGNGYLNGVHRLERIEQKINRLDSLNIEKR